MKLVILGTGAQGTTVASMMDKEENVSEIVCADCDINAAAELASMLKKGEAVYADADDAAALKQICTGADLVVNALPIRFAPAVMDAAIEAGSAYQDFAATDVLDPWWPRCIEIMYDDYGRRFAANGKLAIIGTGSAPGLMCVAARKTMRFLDTCDDILMMVYEGVEAKRFLPFWWSPFTALSDMRDDTFALKDGVLVRTQPHSLALTRHFKGCASPVTLVEHAHDEPVYMGLNRNKFFKGAKNINFKYGGVGVDFASPLYRAGLLSKEEETFNGRTFVPFDVIAAHLPAAPKFPAEIKEILDEGLVKDEGAMVIEATGTKDGRNVKVETYISSPGMKEAFALAQLTAEQYLTGQSGALFTRLFARGEYTQSGLISSDMLTEEECDIYLDYAKALGITVSCEVFTL